MISTPTFPSIFGERHPPQRRRPAPSDCRIEQHHDCDPESPGRLPLLNLRNRRLFSWHGQDAFAPYQHRPRYVEAIHAYRCRHTVFAKCPWIKRSTEVPFHVADVRTLAAATIACAPSVYRVNAIAVHHFWHGSLVDPYRDPLIPFAQFLVMSDEVMHGPLMGCELRVDLWRSSGGTGIFVPPPPPAKLLRTEKPRVRPLVGTGNPCCVVRSLGKLPAASSSIVIHRGYRTLFHQTAPPASSLPGLVRLWLGGACPSLRGQQLLELFLERRG